MSLTTLHAAALGRKRTYPTTAEAASYDAGYRHYPQPIDGCWNRAMQDGWFDAESDAASQAIAQRDGQIAVRRELAWD